MTSLTDFSAAAIDGTDTDLSQYDGKVVLVVNTASQCGFTGQYKGLQQLQLIQKAASNAPADAKDQTPWLYVNDADVITAREPGPAELAVARQALAAVPHDGPLLYARVDLVPGPDGPLLMELELTEPSLFLRWAPGSADRFARAVAARLR